MKYDEFSSLFGHLTLLYSERPKLYGVLAVLSAVGLKCLLKVPIHFTYYVLIIDSGHIDESPEI